jgi:hypothetical protein
LTKEHFEAAGSPAGSVALLVREEVQRQADGLLQRFTKTGAPALRTHVTQRPPNASGRQAPESETTHDYDAGSHVTTSLESVATNTPAGAVVEEGTYVVKTAQGEYVGQSGAISRRLQQHVASGKFTQADVDAAERAMVTGGKLQREIAEQLLIDSKGGIDGLLNKVNPIGPKRVSVMPNQPYKR